MTKLKWGMIGGGEGSQIGPAHRLGAVADGRFELVAAAFDHRPAKGKAFAESLGICMFFSGDYHHNFSDTLYDGFECNYSKFPKNTYMAVYIYGGTPL